VILVELTTEITENFQSKALKQSHFYIPALISLIDSLRSPFGLPRAVFLRSASILSKKSLIPLNPTSYKKINPRPGNDATRPVSTDGQQNELNDRRNTEQDTKLVKIRNNITTGYAKLAENLQCVAKAPQDYRLPEFQFSTNPQF
jgi:hypothetical protein